MYLYYTTTHKLCLMCTRKQAHTQTHTHAGNYLLSLQHMLKTCLSSYFLHKIFGESSQWENSLSQGILGDLTEKKCLVFEVICSFVQPDG